VSAETIILFASLVVSAISLVVTGLSLRHRVKRDELADVDKRLQRLDGEITAVGDCAKEAADRREGKIDDIHDRLVKVESQIEHMPSGDMVHKLETQMARVEGAVSALGENLNAITASVRRIDEYLMRRAELGK